MIRRKATCERATPQEALAALLGIWNRHKFDTFSLNVRGPSAPAILLARELGWAWGDGQGMHVTLDGVRALGRHLGRDLLEEERAAEREQAARELAERDRCRWPEAAE